MKLHLKAFTLFVFLILVTAISTHSVAQNVQKIKKDEITESTDSTSNWKTDLILGANGMQAAYRNWSQGGVNNISATLSGYFRTVYEKDRLKMMLETNLKYGQSRLNGDEVRKTDDQIILNNRWNYQLNGEHFSAFGNISFRSQFTKGYDYKDDAPNVLISDFLAPAYMQQTAGIAYSPESSIDFLGGFGFKETIVNDTDLSTYYGLDAGDKFKFESGLSLQIYYSKQIMDNVTYNGGLSSFTNIGKAITSTDIEFRNEFTGKINDKLNTNFQFIMLYDDDITNAMQIKEVLSVGFSYSLL